MPQLFKNEDVAPGVVSDPISLESSKILLVRADDFGGGVIQIQMRSKGDNGEAPGRFAGLDNADFTSNNQFKLDFLNKSVEVRATLIGGTGATNVFVQLT